MKYVKSSHLLTFNLLTFTIYVEVKHFIPSIPFSLTFFTPQQKYLDDLLTYLSVAFLLLLDIKRNDVKIRYQL